MRSFVVLFAIGGLLGLSTASAQVSNSNTNTNSSPAGQTPTENLRSAASRRPGITIQQATARHRDLINERVNAPRSGEGPDANQNSNSGGLNSGVGNSGALPGGTNLGGLGDLQGLLSLFGGADLGALLGSLTGSVPASEATGAGSTGTTAGSNTAPGDTTPTSNTDPTGDGTGQVDLSNFTPANGTEFTLEDLIRLRDMTEGAAGNQQARNASTAQTVNPPTNTERPFRLRLADRLVSTSFTALNAALRTRPVIDLFKNGIRQAMGLTTPQNNGGNNNGGNGGNGGGNGTDDDVDDSIDDIPAPGSQ